MSKRTSNSKRSTSGNVAIIFALLFPVLLLAAGGGVDIAHYLLRKNQIQDAADAASVGSVSRSSPGYIAGAAMTSDGPVTVGGNQAKNIFNADKPIAGDFSITSFTSSMVRAGTAINAQVAVTGSFTTNFLRLIGINAIGIQVASTATSTIPPYIDFYMVLDNSPSMGVGATTADINNLIAATANKTDSNSRSCAFACHELDKNPNGAANAVDNYTTAKNYNVGGVKINTRIDVVAQATQTLTSTAIGAETVPNQFRMAVYSFGNTADTMGLTPVVQTPSSNLASVGTAAAGVGLMTSLAPGDNNDDDTDFAKIIGGLNPDPTGQTSTPYAIPNPGSGANASAPQKVVFFVSDGMTDAYNGSASTYSNKTGSRPSNTNFGPISQTACSALKSRGILVAVLYTTYLPLPTNSFFVDNIAKFVNAPSQVATAMQNCASPGLYFEVGLNDNLSTAMNALFQRVVTVVRVTS